MVDMKTLLTALSAVFISLTAMPAGSMPDGGAPATRRDLTVIPAGFFPENSAEPVSPPIPSVPAGPASPDRAEVRAVLGKVSVPRLRGYAARIYGFGHRYVIDLEALQNSGNEQAMNFAAETFRSFGLSVERHCYAERAVDPECNIIGRRPGKNPEARAILVIGHLDTVGHTSGADDNASGAAGVLETAGALSGYASGHALIFAASNGEERGMSGAKALLKELKRTGELARLDLVVNMDMIGWNAGWIVDLETDERSAALSDRAAEAARVYTRLKPNIVPDSADGDHIPFLRAGIPAYLSIEHWKKRNPCWHKACDKIEALSWDFAAEVVKMNLAVIAGTTSLTPSR
jgi:hypothetical protein